jgi:hypothetical protein
MRKTIAYDRGAYQARRDANPSATCHRLPLLCLCNHDSGPQTKANRSAAEVQYSLKSRLD